jgi:hypothetical protein
MPKSTKAMTQSGSQLSGISAWLNNPFILQAATKYSSNFILNVAEKISNKFPAIESTIHKGLSSIEEKLTEYNGQHSQISSSEKRSSNSLNA